MKNNTQLPDKLIIRTPAEIKKMKRTLREILMEYIEGTNFSSQIHSAKMCDLIYNPWGRKDVDLALDEWCNKNSKLFAFEIDACYLGMLLGRLDMLNWMGKDIKLPNSFKKDLHQYLDSFWSKEPPLPSPPPTPPKHFPLPYQCRPINQPAK